MLGTYDLSILIPARNEIFLSRTVEDILTQSAGKTEVIVVCDGYKPEPVLKADPRATLIYHSQPIGQRAATNEAAKLSKAKYVMKCDAHCAFDQGFDVKMMAEMHDDWTMVPLMRNLHAFDWVCEQGHRRYQGPSGPCAECGKETKRDVVWIPKNSPKSRSYCFDSTPHFQYFGEYSKRPEVTGEITETMSLQGSCWMLTREKYFELQVCDENFGSWGSQGIEVAAKTWLSGGRVVCNQKTWYAHMFRTQGGDFGFPYPMSGKQQAHAKSFARNLFFNNKWPLQKRPLSWLIEKFWPVKGWTEEDLAKLKTNTFQFSGKTTEKSEESEPSFHDDFTDSLDSKSQIIWSRSELQTEKSGSFSLHAEMKPDTSEHQLESKASEKLLTPPARHTASLTVNTATKGIIYYTDSQLDPKIAQAVQNQLQIISDRTHLPMVTASLKRMHFGVKNIHFPSLQKGYPAMFKQIMSALEHSKSEIIFFCEHDVLYHPSHFDFTPPDKNTFYYNQNVWFLRVNDGHALHYDVNQLSGLCGWRESLYTHFKERFELVEKEGFTRTMGFEPMTHNRIKWKQMFKLGTWKSELPNIDIRHAANVTGQRWKKEDYRNQKLLINWVETDDEIPGWGKTKELIKKFS